MMKRAILVAIVAVAAMGFSASSAMAWSPGGFYTFSDSNLRSTLELGGGVNNPFLECNVAFEGALHWTDNNGSVIDAITNPCTSSTAGCAVAVDADDRLPWGIYGDDVNDTADITGVYFIATYSNLSGQTCALGAGTQLTVEGDVTGDYSVVTTGCTGSDERGSIDFDNASGLEVTASNNPGAPVGTDVTLDGTVETACLANAPDFN